MLTQREKDFLHYWAQNRLKRKKTVRQFLIGIPIGMAFAIPILINFGSGWYRRADMEANTPDFNPLVLLVALILIVGFVSIFYQKHKWDQYDQRYRELLAQQEREGGEENTADPIRATSPDSPHLAVSDSMQPSAPNSTQTSAGNSTQPLTPESTQTSALDSTQISAPDPAQTTGPDPAPKPGPDSNQSNA